MSADKIPHGHVFIIYAVLHGNTVLGFSESWKSEEFPIILWKSSKTNTKEKSINRCIYTGSNAICNASFKNVKIIKI